MISIENYRAWPVIAIAITCCYLNPFSIASRAAWALVFHQPAKSGRFLTELALTAREILKFPVHCRDGCVLKRGVRFQVQLSALQEAAREISRTYGKCQRTYGNGLGTYGRCIVTYPELERTYPVE